MEHQGIKKRQILRWKGGNRLHVTASPKAISETIALEFSGPITGYLLIFNTVIIKMQDTTTTVQPLLEYFNRLIPLTKEEEVLVHEKFHPHLFLKKQFALQHGDMCQYFDFVVRGCLRLYKVGDDGVYHILQFATENHWIQDLTSFHQRKPAKLNIDALEDTVVLRINYADLIDLYLKSPRFDRIFRVLLENHFMMQQQRMAQLFSSTAEERYQLFQETYPHLMNRLSQVQIAAYLGITPEFLSRIRSRLAKESR